MVKRRQKNNRKNHTRVAKKHHKRTTRKIMKKHSHMAKKHHKTRLNKRKRKTMKRKTHKNMRGGMQPLDSSSFSKHFMPKELNNVPFLPSGGGAKIGIAYPHKYYSLATPDLHAPNNYLQQSYGVQTGGGIIPEPLLQLGRGVVYNMQSLYDNYVGQPTYISKDPNPLAQPIAKNNVNLNVDPVDINKIQLSAQKKAANFNV